MPASSISKETAERIRDAWPHAESVMDAIHKAGLRTSDIRSAYKYRRDAEGILGIKLPTIVRKVHSIDCASLREFASVRDHEILDAMEAASGSKSIAARAMGLNLRTVQRALDQLELRAARSGVSPKHDMVHPAAPGFVVKGTSTYYDEDGKVRAQWVKTREDSPNSVDLRQAFLDAFIDDIPRLTAVKPGATDVMPDSLNVYVYGDPHIGMRAWSEETGEDHDLQLAEALFTGAHADLVSRSPFAAEAIILNLGDYFHADDGQNRTMRSGHPLDVDGRYQKVRKVGFRILREMVRMALGKHERVTVWNIIGNHDDYSAVDLSLWLQVAYESEPRVHIETSANKFYYRQFGKVMLAATHGDTVKPDALLGIMASDQPAMWGETRYRYAHIGHIHHKTLKDLAGVCIETHRVLQPADLWAHNAGYRAMRDAQCITYHRDFGEYARTVVNPAMIQSKRD